MANVEDIEGEGSVQVNGPPQFNDQPNFRTLREYLHPARQSTPSCIILPLNQQAFNLKPGMIQLLPTFHGMDSENPYIHIKEFEEVCNTFIDRTCTEETIRLKLFPFSLKDKAKLWLNSLDFKKLVSTMCNGEFYDKEPSEAFDFFDQLAENTKQWETSLPLHVESRNTISHSSGKFQLKETDDLNARLASLARKVESLEIKKVHGMSEQQEESCVVCEGKGHRTTECPTIPAFKEVLYGQTFDSSNVRKPFSNQARNPYSILIILDGGTTQILDGEMRALQYLKHFNLHPNHFMLPHITHTNHLIRDP
ncbi:hypothetical protein OIU85_022627 [Salix viminalis]|uniref:Retrotransposon gag domain-containing protein n=1 Tax=Salix viminalis TaxID=40686 RepID=A0A9Q0U7B7_SALVM|nr:hypothetical protein OIU85_022627 [Salix viminalis]